MTIVREFRIFCFIAVFAAAGYSQAVTPCEANSDIKKVADGWLRYSAGGFSFCLPSELKPKKAKCFDGGCFRFDGEGMILMIDLDAAAGRPNSQRHLKTYREEFISVDGKPAWIWYFETDGKMKGSSGVSIKVNDREKANMYFFSAEPGRHDLARKIFTTIRFNY